jgi:hypothetical protein
MTEELISSPQLPEISLDMNKRDRKKIEREIILPYLNLFTDIGAKDLSNRGLEYSDPHIYAMMKKLEKAKQQQQ